MLLLNLPPSSLRSSQGLIALASLAFLSPLLYFIALCVYNIWFHPLAQYPGPLFARVSQFWRVFSYLRGTEHLDLFEAHKKYGEVIRIAPNELSYIHPNAWKEIYGHGVGGKQQFPKDKKHHAQIKVENILTASNTRHGYLRKLMAHSFSEKALKEQEAVFQEHVDMMIKNLAKETSNGQRPADLVSWFNCFTFDVIGYLTYGETFESIAKMELNPWIELTFKIIRASAFRQTLSHVPPMFRSLIRKLYEPGNQAAFDEFNATLIKEKISRRMNTQLSTTGLIDKFIDAYQDGKMSLAQLESNAFVMIMGGSETTATLLSGMSLRPSKQAFANLTTGATYYLLKYPETLAKLTSEIRGTFANSADINGTRLGRCKYLLACIDEALRIYPPSPQTHARAVPEGGATLCGKFVPEGVTVGVPIYAVCRSPWNFKHPESFIPERWLNNDRDFESDRREAALVFSTGPRACIGRNLAHLEMRLVLAKLLWHYDLERSDNVDWANQKMYILWDKPKLLVTLIPR